MFFCRSFLILIGEDLQCMDNLRARLLRRDYSVYYPSFRRDKRVQKFLGIFFYGLFSELRIRLQLEFPLVKDFHRAFWPHDRELS